MVPVTAPLLSAARFTCQGRAVAFRKNLRFSGLVQLVKPTAEIEPTPEPDSPVPRFSVPVMLTDVQVKTLPVAVSLKVAVPDFAVKLPPGLTVQVVAASAAVTPRHAARAAAGAASSTRVRGLDTRLIPPVRAAAPGGQP